MAVNDMIFYISNLEWYLWHIVTVIVHFSKSTYYLLLILVIITKNMILLQEREPSLVIR